MASLPKGYRIVPGPTNFNPSVGRKVHSVLLQRWESRVIGPFWHRRLDFDWHTIAQEFYTGYGSEDSAPAIKRLQTTAALEEETRPIELRWTQRGTGKPKRPPVDNVFVRPIGSPPRGGSGISERR